MNFALLMLFLQIIGGETGFKEAFEFDAPDVPEKLKKKSTKAKKATQKLRDTAERIELKDFDEGSDRAADPGIRNVAGELDRVVADPEIRDFFDVDDLKEAARLLRRNERERGKAIVELNNLVRRKERQFLKLNEVDGDPAINNKEAQKKDINDRIETLDKQRETLEKALRKNYENSRSQVARIRQTIEKVLDSDTSLAEKIKTLFREQGITIAAIVTAIGLIITTIVEAVLPGSTAGGAAGAAGGSSTTDKAKDWIKKQLKNIANLLGKLAAKFGAALPGILGSIVTWLLTAMKDGALFLAEHLWLLIVGIIALAYSYITKKRK